jgi:CRISPR system Cascade subunit CasA
MNLISDPWIPIQRKSGEEARIAPSEVTSRYSDDPIVALAAPRPDFNGTLIQFLIGLLQTTCAPDSPRTWREWLRDPPTPAELQAKFQPIAYAFELDGDGPRFMQDRKLGPDVVKEPTPVAALLVELPGENTIQRNTDHFIKHGGIEKLCSSCTATALFSLQTNAPSGGQGHRTGLRGGDPLRRWFWATCSGKPCGSMCWNARHFLHTAGILGKLPPISGFPGSQRRIPVRRAALQKKLPL